MKVRSDWRNQHATADTKRAVRGRAYRREKQPTQEDNVNWLSSLFGFGGKVQRPTVTGDPPPVSRADLDRAYSDMRNAMANETPEQKQRFYLEVAALLGNESAAKMLNETMTAPTSAHGSPKA